MSSAKRRFQFSLRAAIVMMILAGMAVGVYVRWPYYVAGRTLDEALAGRQFSLWPKVRTALVNDDEFRKELSKANAFAGISIESNRQMSVKVWLTTFRSTQALSRNIYIEDDGQITVMSGFQARLFAEPRK